MNYKYKINFLYTIFQLSETHDQILITTYYNRTKEALFLNKKSLIRGQYWSSIYNYVNMVLEVTPNQSLWKQSWFHQLLLKDHFDVSNKWRTDVILRIYVEDHNGHLLTYVCLIDCMMIFEKFVDIMKENICFWISTGWLLSFWHLMSSLPSSVLFWHAWLALLFAVVCPVSLLFSMLLQDRYE